MPKKSRFRVKYFYGLPKRYFKGMKFFYFLLGNISWNLRALDSKKTPLDIRVFSAQYQGNVHSKKK